MASGGGVVAMVGLAGEALAARPGAERTGDDTRLIFEATDHVRWYYSRARW